jgi:hypothetical protein
VAGDVGSRPRPDADDSAYLKAVIAADDQPSPVTRLLTER